MILVPSVFNVFQVWIQDNILKKSDFSDDIELKADEDSLPNAVKNFKINKNQISFDLEMKKGSRLSVKIEESPCNQKNDINDTKDTQRIELLDTSPKTNKMKKLRSITIV